MSDNVRLLRPDCPHVNCEFTIDYDERRCLCGLCGAEVDSFVVLARLTDHNQRIDLHENEIELRASEVADLAAQQKALQAELATLRAEDLLTLVKQGREALDPITGYQTIITARLNRVWEPLEAYVQSLPREPQKP